MSLEKTLPIFMNLYALLTALAEPLQVFTMAKKDIEIQPGFEPGSSECRSDALTN